MVSGGDLLTRKQLEDKFGWEEYFIFCLMLAISAAMGGFFWWKGQKDSEEFLLGGRNIGTFPITMSLTVRYANNSVKPLYDTFPSFMSAITMLGTPAEVYVYGTQYSTLVLGLPFVMAISAHLFLPVYYKLNVTSCYEVCFCLVSLVLFCTVFRMEIQQASENIGNVMLYCQLFVVHGHSCLCSSIGHLTK